MHKSAWPSLLRILAVSYAASCVSVGAVDVNSQLVEDLMAKMTLEEKVGQLELYSRPSGSDFNGQSIGWNTTVKLIRAGQVGALFNGAGVAVNRELQRIAVEESRLGIPMIFGADIWHGMWTIFPAPLAEAASWEPALARRTARATAKESTASGLMWTFSPMVDTARDQRWGRNIEGAGEDPFLGEAFARARVQGFQGPDLKSEDSLASCLKHFAGYGGVLAGLDYSESDMSEATFRDVFLPPFLAGIRAGALSIMSAFQTLEGIPATGNQWLLSDVLRTELGFEGFVVTDYEADLELVAHGYARNASDAARIALSAGVDMSMQSGVFQNLPQLIAHGLVSQRRLDEAVRRVLQAKASMGLLANPYKTLNPATEWPKSKHADQEAHDQLARDSARRSMVLLKNDKGTLPLKKSQKIAVIGWWTNDTDTDGVGVLWGNKSHTVTLLQGLQAVVPPSQLRWVKGSDVEAEIPGGTADALAAAAWADVVLLALGESSELIGEARSRTELTLPEAQQRLAEAVAPAGKPLVVLLKNGRAMELRGTVKESEAILVTWFLGKMTGHAIADVLFGDYSPSGRLPITFPIAGGQQPLYYNRMSSGRPCLWPSRWTNCYLRVPNKALYSFGHGLTYSTIEYGPPILRRVLPWDGILTIACNVSNTGGRAVEEVVQLYIHDRIASRVRPVRELKGFQKILLQKGESQTIVFQLSRHDLAFTGPAHSLRHGLRIVEPGVFDVWVAPSSTEGLAAHFELEGPVERLI